MQKVFSNAIELVLRKKKMELIVKKQLKLLVKSGNIAFKIQPW